MNRENMSTKVMPIQLCPAGHLPAAQVNLLAADWWLDQEELSGGPTGHYFLAAGQLITGHSSLDRPVAQPVSLCRPNNGCHLHQHANPVTTVNQICCPGMHGMQFWLGSITALLWNSRVGLCITNWLLLWHVWASYKSKFFLRSKSPLKGL